AGMAHITALAAPRKPRKSRRLRCDARILSSQDEAAEPEGPAASDWRLLRLPCAEGERLDDHTIDVALLHIALEVLGAGAGSLQHHVVNGMHAGVAAARDIALDENRARNVLVCLVGDILLVLVLDGGDE